MSSDGTLYRILYQFVRKGVRDGLRLKRGLGLAFKPGQLTISRKGSHPSGQEKYIILNSLKKALKDANFLNESPDVEMSPLLTWRDKDAFGYRYTWENNDANEER